MTLALILLWLAPADAPPAAYVIGGAGGGERYFVPDPVLGYRPRAGVRVRARRTIDGHDAYDVRYTIDDDGLRRTPGSRRDGPAVVFFGGSFTFGEGVEDDQTLPAAFADLAGGAHVVNAGFHGYGPHQMLRSLETGRLDARVPDGVRAVVYQGIDAHVGRVAGRTTWDLAGPSYELRDGTISYVGPFRSGPWFWVARALAHFGPTRRLLARWLAHEAEAADRDLYVEIVARAASLARERWGASFTVVYWDDVGEVLANRLRDRGLDVLSVREALGPGERRSFALAGDGHPTARAHRRLARRLVARVNAEGDRTMPLGEASDRGGVVDAAAMESWRAGGG